MSAEELSAQRVSLSRLGSGESSASTGIWSPGLLHLGLAAVLLVEIAFVREHFNTDRFLGDDRPWTQLLLATRNAAPVGIASFAAWLLIAWRSLVREYGGLVQNARTSTSSAVWFGLQLAVFAGFYRLTEWMFVALDGVGSLAAFAWVGVWCASALAVPFSAGAIAFPQRALAASLYRLLPSLLLASGIGVGAFAVSRAVLELGLWLPLLSGTTQLAHWILGVVTDNPAPVQAIEGEGFTLGAGSFQVLISQHCSGFEGIALIWTFLAAYFVGFRTSLRFPHVLVLVPIATLLVWGMNGIRLAALVWIGARLSPEVAMQGFHSYAGWIVFCGLSLSVVYASRRVAWFASDSPGAARAHPADTTNPAAAYLGPFLGVLATSFVTGAFSNGFDAFYPVRVLVGATLLWCVRAELPRARLAVSKTGLLYGAAAFVVWTTLERLGVQVRSSDAAQGLADLSPLAAGFWLVFRALGFLLVAPLAEELAFRGFLARRLVSADFESISYRALTPFAWAVSALAFGLLHGQWIAGTLTGLLFGLALLRRARLSDAIVAHATTNALLLLSSLVFGPRLGWL